MLTNLWWFSLAFPGFAKRNRLSYAACWASHNENVRFRLWYGLNGIYMRLNYPAYHFASLKVTTTQRNCSNVTTGNQRNDFFRNCHGFVYFEQLKTFHWSLCHGTVVVTNNLRNRRGSLLQQLWGFLFSQNYARSVVDAFHKFFVDP